MQNQELNNNIILPSALALLKESFILYKRKFVTILGIVLPVFLITMIFGDKLIAGKFITGYANIYYTIIFILAFISELWSTAALLYMAKNESERISAVEAYRMSSKKIIPYTLLAILLSFIIIGGFFLAIIPGIIFLVWFSFAHIILIAEDEGVKVSLLKSKEYIRKHWWAIVWRHIFIIAIVSFAIILFGVLIIGPVLVVLNLPSKMAAGYISPFIWSLVVLYSFVTYRHLKQGKPENVLPIAPIKTKVMFGLAGILGMPIALSLFVISFLAYVFAADAPPPNDSDLRLPKIAVSDEENAFYDLEKILMYTNVNEDVIYYPIEQKDLITEYINNRNWDEEFVRDLLSKNESVFKYLDIAKTKPKFQNPLTQDPENLIIDPEGRSLNPVIFINIAKLDSLRSLSIFKDGQEQLALENAMQFTLFNQKIHNSQSGLLYYLASRPSKNIGLERINQIVADSTKLSSDILANYARRLDDIENSSGLKKAFMMEYTDQAVQFNKLSNAPSFYYFKQNKTKQYLVDNARIYIKSAEASCFPIATFEDANIAIEEVKQFSNSFHSITGLIKIPFTENFIGKQIQNFMFIYFNPSSMYFNRCNDDVMLSATKLIFALKAYNIDNGDLPQSLEVLVPKYIAKVPEDPFDGKSMKYLKDKKIIWSIGKDGIDSGGSEGDNWETMPDPTFSVDFGSQKF